MNTLMGSDSKRLWSLWDMMRVYAHHYLDIGEHVQNVKLIFGDSEGAFDGASLKKLDVDEFQHVREALKKLIVHCDALELIVSSELIKARLTSLPKTGGEFGVIVDAVYAELRNKLFLFTPPHLAKYYDNHDVLSPRATLAFPSPRYELWDASIVVPFKNGTR
jgi:hypothetical protein